MPDVAVVLGLDRAPWFTSVARRGRCVVKCWVAFGQDATDRCWSKNKASACEHLCDADLPHRRNQCLQLFHELADEVRKAIGRLFQLDEGTLSQLVHSSHPSRKRLFVEEETVCCVGTRPRTRGSELQDAHPLGGGEVWPAA